MSVTSEINDCILKNNGSERDALNVTLAKLHDAEGRISSLRAILFDILEDDEPAQPEGDAAYWRAKAEAFQARAKYLENKYRWIPVEEHLPEANGYFLAKIEKRIDILDLTIIHAAVVYYCVEYGWDTLYGSTVISWMPLELPMESDNNL